MRFFDFFQLSNPCLKVLSCLVPLVVCFYVLPSAAQEKQKVLNCSVKPSKVINISSPIGGVLAEVFVRPGQKVSAGDLIARLDTDIHQADLEAAKVRAFARGEENVARARYAAAQKRFNEARVAFNNRVLPRVEYSGREAELTIANQELQHVREGHNLTQAEVTRLEILVSKGEIRAPETGIIGEELLSKSESVDGRAIAQLIVIDPLRVEVFANSQVVEEIEAGGKFAMVAGIAKPQIIDIDLDYISPIADPRSKIIKVFYTHEGSTVRPGTQCFFAKDNAIQDALNFARARQNKQ